MAQVLQLQTLFASELLSIRHGAARPAPTQGDDIECESADLVLLPIAGVFAKHDGPKQHVIANPNHALFLGCGKPYRITFPDGIGDESLVLDFSQAALARLLAETVGVQSLYSPALHTHCLLSAAAVLNREQLWRRLAHGAANPLAIEEICVSMLAAAVQAACKDNRQKERARHVFTQARRRQQVEIVKELISLFPTREWTLGELAREAGLSPFHLARVFREEVGVPVHRYLIRTRLGKALQAMRSADADLTGIAQDAGFANHSHFTLQFRSLFGVTPSQLRKIMVAPVSRDP